MDRRMLGVLALAGVLGAACTVSFEASTLRVRDTGVDVPVSDLPGLDTVEDTADQDGGMDAPDADAGEASTDGGAEGGADGDGGSCGGMFQPCCAGASRCGPTLVCSLMTCVPCPVGFLDCAGTCVAIATNPLHCGLCNNPCPEGQSCTGGSCVCPTGQTECTGRCVTTASDPLHCGACGRACAPDHATGACVAGACVVSSCAEGYADCDRNPANGCETAVQTDARNCGGCGTSCSFARASASCVAGACVLGTCEAGYADCDGQASNGCETALQTNGLHCGRCDNACEAAGGSSTCRAGACVTTACEPGLGDCDGNDTNGCETNTQTNAAHCGACGNACAFSNATATCAAGVCALGSCSAGSGDCDGDASNGCETALTTSESHCGACGRACRYSNAAGVCAAGACSLGACSTGFSDCNRVSTDGCEVNLGSDPAHCGGCGTTCSVPNATATCVAGRCGLGACNRGFANCDGNDANGCEVNLGTDAANCGACGSVCSRANAGATCAGGACSLGACSAGYGNCDGNDANGCEASLQTDVAHCGACGTACVLANASAACLAGRCSVGACASGFANCDGSDTNGCEVNLGTDTRNCGRCGGACPSGQVCAGGVCAADCGPGQRDCAGRCADIATDAANCGTCGNVCGAPPRSTATCEAGVCGFRCVDGYADCNRNAADGCEVDLRTSVTHCGRCGGGCVAGANATAVCINGACGLTCTSAQYANCDGSAANGCEVDVTTSLSHCGACGAACAAPGATLHQVAVCSGGVCGRACVSGYENCDSNSMNGCEANLASITSCGRCNNVCPSRTNAAAACTAGVCGITCNLGYGNCDENNSNGCEINLRTSNDHCGRCGARCTLPHALAACSGGVCGLNACGNGYGDCNMVVADGCEAYLLTDPNHCGSCGNRCPSGQCASRVCCSSGRTSCGGACVNLNQNELHCGACGHACSGSQECCRGTCVSRGSCTALCGSTCPTPSQLCCSGSCVNITSDVENCGLCGTTCSSGRVCSSGVCRTP